jgi:predicted Rossmann fold nucleotide-binding protein DprA/Smf involved in DNA uptake
MSTRSPRHELDIARRSGLSLTAVQSVLGRLALEGDVAERSGGWVLR